MIWCYWGLWAYCTREGSDRKCPLSYWHPKMFILVVVTCQYYYDIILHQNDVMYFKPFAILVCSQSASKIGATITRWHVGETKKRLFPKKYTDRHVHVAIWDIIFHSLICVLLLRKTILAVGKMYTKPWVEVMKLGFFLTYWIVYLPSSGQLDVAHCSFRTQWSSNDMWRSHVDWNFSYASSRHIYHSYRRQPWKGKMPSDPVTQTKHEQNL